MAEGSVTLTGPVILGGRQAYKGFRLYAPADTVVYLASYTLIDDAGNTDTWPKPGSPCGWFNEGKACSGLVGEGTYSESISSATKVGILQYNIVTLQNHTAWFVARAVCGDVVVAYARTEFHKGVRGLYHSGTDIGGGIYVKAYDSPVLTLEVDAHKWDYAGTHEQDPGARVEHVGWPYCTIVFTVGFNTGQVQDPESYAPSPSDEVGITLFLNKTKEMIYASANNSNYGHIEDGEGNVIEWLEVEWGETCTLTAVPDDCCAFVRWEVYEYSDIHGISGSTSATVSFTAVEYDDDCHQRKVHYRAVFERAVQVYVHAESETGKVEKTLREWSNYTGKGCGEASTDDGYTSKCVPHNTNVTLVAKPSCCSEFVKWVVNYTDDWGHSASMTLNTSEITWLVRRYANTQTTINAYAYFRKKYTVYNSSDKSRFWLIYDPAHNNRLLYGTFRPGGYLTDELMAGGVEGAESS